MQQRAPMLDELLIGLSRMRRAKAPASSSSEVVNAPPRTATAGAPLVKSASTSVRPRTFQVASGAIDHGLAAWPSLIGTSHGGPAVPQLSVYSLTLPIMSSAPHRDRHEEPRPVARFTPPVVRHAPPAPAL